MRPRGRGNQVAAAPARAGVAGLFPAVVLGLLCVVGGHAAADSTDSTAASAAEAVPEDTAVAAGRRLFHEGRLRSGEALVGTLFGGAELTGAQVACSQCHRRSGMGSIEGQEVVPSITGDLLYNPLQLPTVKPPAPPVLRPAYTDASLKQAIREGHGADGQPLSGFMPRYALADADLDVLIAYLKTLESAPAPGVTAEQMHFATIVSDSVDPATRQAMLDVYRVFVEQKNRETRHETDRATNAPWHRAWKFKPYRKWALHVWELQGPPDTWRQQLDRLLEAQPVFAVLGGLVEGEWRPIHEFCEASTLPCLFPVTDLPVIDEDDYYTVYFSRGMTLEADVVASDLARDPDPMMRPVVQVYRSDDPRSRTAAQRLRGRLEAQGRPVVDIALDGTASPGPEFWASVLEQSVGASLVLWLSEHQTDALWVAGADGPARVYLSTTLFDHAGADMPDAWRGRVLFVHPSALPQRQRRLLARSNGWLRVNRIQSPQAAWIQGDALFTLKIAGEAVRMIRGYFNQEYFLERIEHIAENAVFTSIYPTISLAPGQRFLSKGAYIAQYGQEGSNELVAVSDWIVANSP